MHGGGGAHKREQQACSTRIILDSGTSPSRLARTIWCVSYLWWANLRAGFVKVRELHKEACAGGAALEVAALKAQAGVLGLGGLSGPAMAELSQMLASSKRTLGADDLLMVSLLALRVLGGFRPARVSRVRPWWLNCAAVHHLLQVLTIVYFTSPESSGELAPEIVAMLDVVEQAFMHFDTSLDGMLEREELDAVLRHGSEVRRVGPRGGVGCPPHKASRWHEPRPARGGGVALQGGHEDAVKRRRHKHKHAGVGERLFDLLDFDHRCGWGLTCTLLCFALCTLLLRG